MAKQRYTAAQLIAAAKATGGNKSAAARSQLGCDRQTVQNYCNRYPTVNRAFEEERQAMVDWAESGLRDAVISGKEPWAIKFTLATLGKDRGYTEKHETELTGPDSQPLFEDVAKPLEQIARRIDRIAPLLRGETSVPSQDSTDDEGAEAP